MNEGFGYLLSICMYSEYLSFIFLTQIYPPPQIFQIFGRESVIIDHLSTPRILFNSSIVKEESYIGVITVASSISLR